MLWQISSNALAMLRTRPWSAIYPFSKPLLVSVAEGLMPIPAYSGWKAGIHPGQVSNPSHGPHTIHSHTHTPRPQLINLHVFWLREVIKVCGKGGTCKPTQKGPRPGFKPRAFLLWGKITTAIAILSLLIVFHGYKNNQCKLQIEYIGAVQHSLMPSETEKQPLGFWCYILEY